MVKILHWNPSFGQTNYEFETLGIERYTIEWPLLFGLRRDICFFLHVLMSTHHWSLSVATQPRKKIEGAIKMCRKDNSLVRRAIHWYRCCSENYRARVHVIFFLIHIQTSFGKLQCSAVTFFCNCLSGRTNIVERMSSASKLANLGPGNRKWPMKNSVSRQPRTDSYCIFPPFSPMIVDWTSYSETLLFMGIFQIPFTGSRTMVMALKMLSPMGWTEWMLGLLPVSLMRWKPFQRHGSACPYLFLSKSMKSSPSKLSNHCPLFSISSRWNLKLSDPVVKYDSYFGSKLYGGIVFRYRIRDHHGNIHTGWPTCPWPMGLSIWVWVYSFPYVTWGPNHPDSRQSRQKKISVSSSTLCFPRLPRSGAWWQIWRGTILLMTWHPSAMSKKFPIFSFPVTLPHSLRHASVKAQQSYFLASSPQVSWGFAEGCEHARVWIQQAVRVDGQRGVGRLHRNATRLNCESYTQWLPKVDKLRF